MNRDKIYLVFSCIAQLLPALVVAVLIRDIVTMDCITATNKSYLAMFALFIFSYINTNYVRMFLAK